MYFVFSLTFLYSFLTIQLNIRLAQQIVLLCLESFNIFIVTN